MLGAVLALISVGATACIAAYAPALGACAPGLLPDDAPSRGALRVIPSAVPGVEIDTAFWQTWARARDLGAQEGIAYVATIRFRRVIPPGRLALLYQTRGLDGSPTLGVNPSLDGLRLRREISLADSTATVPDSVRTIVTDMGLEPGSSTGTRSSLTQCPSAVRIIPRSDIALYLQSGADAADSRTDLERRILASDTSSDPSPLRVLAPKGASDWPGGRMYGGMTVNTTDTLMTNVIAALVIERPPFGANRESEIPWRRDTIEFLIPRIPPRALVGFFGIPHGYRERVIGRFSRQALYVNDHRQNEDPQATHRMRAINAVRIVAVTYKRHVDSSLVMRATAVDRRGLPIEDFDGEPRWRIESNEAGARLSQTTGREVELRAERAGRVSVGVMVEGVYARTEFMFTPATGAPR